MFKVALMRIEVKTLYSQEDFLFDLWCESFSVFPPRSSCLCSSSFSKLPKRRDTHGCLHLQVGALHEQDPSFLFADVPNGGRQRKSQGQRRRLVSSRSNSTSLPFKFPCHDVFFFFGKVILTLCFSSPHGHPSWLTVSSHCLVMSRQFPPP